ncbi:MAG: P27 family phage terminase small subunit [Oscillospiraceae bacterium]|nr:P27 family phage terminase small subunit [Oscillospiraceae bacterium]
MGRPAKATAIQSANLTKLEKDTRKAAEDELRGQDDRIVPPDWLNEGQKTVFEFVVAEMEASRVLGNLDVFVLTQFAVVTERIFDLEQMINEDARSNLQSKELIFARNSYIKDFWRGANELSLSPQARAKIGILNLAKKEEDKDPLKKILAGRV